MTADILIVLIIMAATFALLLWERWTCDMVAMLALLALLFTGVLTPPEAFAVFGNEAVVAIAAMLILGAGLDHSGVMGSLARRLDRFAGRSELAVLLLMLPLVAGVSAFINNTAVVVGFIPIMITLARERGIAPTRLLIPLSFASILGGTCTLIGTSTNILVDSSLRSLGREGIGMFELARIGGILVLAGILYLVLLGRRWLPWHSSLEDVESMAEERRYLTEFIVTAESRLVGRKIGETPLLTSRDCQIHEIIREGDSQSGPYDKFALRAGDRLRFSTKLASMMELKNFDGLQFLPEEELGLELVGTQEAVLVECIPGPNSSFVGKTIRELDLQRRFGVRVLALHRRDVNLREHLGGIRLEIGDTLLVEGPKAVIRRIRESGDFMLLFDVPRARTRPRPRKIAIGIVVAVVALAATGVMPISVLALAGAALMIVTGCLEVQEAYRSLQWQTLFLICGMLGIGLAMEKTGATVFVVSAVMHELMWLSPWLLLSMLFLLTSVFTQFLSNNAVAVLLTPIAVHLAETVGVDARPFVIAVAIGASACFATPLGYQTNTLVYAAGGYRFRDFLRIGLPLNLIVWLLGSALIPWLWPF